MRSPTVIAATLLAVALAGCGDPEIRKNTDDKPTAAVKRLLTAAPATECAAQAGRDRQLAFVKDHPQLTNHQLAKICPDLYPRAKRKPVTAG